MTGAHFSSLFPPFLHRKPSERDDISWRALRWRPQQAYLYNLQKDIHIKVHLRPEFTEWISITLSYSSPPTPNPPTLTTWFPALSITFLPLSLSFSSSIFRTLLGHDKSKRDVMTRDPLLALVGGRENERENKEGWGGMKEICLEMIAHKALILCFNLAQCAQISY